MHIKKLAQACTGGLLAACLAVSAQAQEKVNLTVISGLSEAAAGVATMTGTFIPEVDRILAESGAYRVNWTLALGGTVAKQPAVFEAIESGIGDIGYVNVLLEGDKLPLEQVCFATPYGATDVKVVTDALTELRRRVPAMDAAFEKHNQKFLAAIGIDNYQLLTKEKVPDFAALQGLKLGVPGPVANWIKDTGAVGVAGSLTEYYNAMRTGVYDGIIVYGSALNSFKYHEVAPYITRLDFGAAYASALTINKRRFDGLPAEVQAAILQASAVYQDKVVAVYSDLADQALKTAVADGAEIVEWAPEDRAAMAAAIPNYAKLWAEDADARGLPGTEVLGTYMALNREAGVTYLRDWDKE